MALPWSQIIIVALLFALVIYLIVQAVFFGRLQSTPSLFLSTGRGYFFFNLIFIFLIVVVVILALYALLSPGEEKTSTITPPKEGEAFDLSNVRRRSTIGRKPGTTPEDTRYIPFTVDEELTYVQ